MEQKISKKALENGNLLRSLKHTFLTTQNPQTLMPVLACLRDSEVVVPVRLNVSDAQAESILSADKHAPIIPNEDISFTPDLLQSEDGIFMPIFSSEGQLKTEYAQNFSMMRISAVQCIRLMLQMPDINGLVLDAFTEAMLIPKESAEIILKMKSHLKESQ